MMKWVMSLICFTGEKNVATYTVKDFKEDSCTVINLLLKQVNSCCLHRYSMYVIAKIECCLISMHKWSAYQ